jgi:hypothetical protein
MCSGRKVENDDLMACCDVQCGLGGDGDPCELVMQAKPSIEELLSRATWENRVGWQIYSNDVF